MADQTEDKKKGLQGAFDGLKSAVGDLSSLEVQTYTGSIEVNINEKGTPVKFEEYLLAAKGSEGSLSLVALTKMNFDGDTINLVPPGEFKDHVRNVHEAAVKAGVETRQGLLKLFGDIIGLK